MAVPVEAVAYLVDNTAQLLKYNYNLVADVGVKIEDLQKELKPLEGLMTDIATSNHDSDYLKSLVKWIKSVIDDAEDAVDTYVALAAMHKSKSWVNKTVHFVDYPKKLRAVGKKIEDTRVELRRLAADVDVFGIPLLLYQFERGLTQSSMPTKDPIVEEEHVVGFDKAIKEVSQLLVGGFEKFEVISIVGMLGLGKTTLAKKVFNQPNVEVEYKIQVFVYISATYDIKKVFLKILKSFTIVDERVNQMSEHDLKIHLCNKLKGKQYLIILDDIWMKNDWDRLRPAFPINDNRCRILITTRSDIVAGYARNSITPFYRLDLLPLDKSKELLHWKVFRSNEIHPKLSPFEELIALKCDGLPLSIVVIAGMIFNRQGDVDWWKNIAKSASDFLPEETTKVVEFMYKNLPNHLKLCFMYMGLFSEGYEIPV